jgi:metalloendopeptidase OMA1, mitochondrial
MKTLVRTALVATALTLFVSACAKVPVTGRRQFNVIPNGVMTKIGETSYRQTLSQKNVIKEGEDAALMRKVGKRIAVVADQPDFDWSYALIRDKSMNAWCLPGGYIGVFTGILPAMENEAGMAFVMGHEVGHAVARHGAERLSQQIVVLGGIAGLVAIADSQVEMDDKQRAIVFGAMGLGAEVGILLPFSRSHESEADVIGMMYAAGAGYPPGEGIALWDRMSALSRGPEAPTWISTHPANEDRQANMREWMGRAKKRFERNKLGYDTRIALWSK